MRNRWKGLLHQEGREPLTSYLKKKIAPTDKAWGDEKAQHICNM